MKKITALILFCFLIWGFSACTSKNLDEMNRALEKTAAADAADISVKTEVYVSIGGKTDSFSSESSAKMKGLQTKSPSFCAKTNVNLFGERAEATVYYEDSFYYVVTEEDAVKLASGELIEKTDFVSDWRRAMCPFSEKNGTKAELSFSEGNQKTFTVTADIDRFSEEYAALLQEWKLFLLDHYVVAYTESSFSLEGAEYVVSLNAETEEVLSFTASAKAVLQAKNVTGEEISLSADIEHTIVCNGLGEAVVPDVPKGYADFPITDGLVLDPYLVSKKAIDSVLSLSDIDADVTLSVTAEFYGEKFEIPLKYKVRVTGAQTEAPVFDYHLDISDDYGTTEENVYFKDGYYYVESTDFVSAKYPKTAENDRLYGYEALIHDLMKPLAPSDLEGIEVQKKKDGMRRILIRPTAERLGELYPSFLERVTETYSDAQDLDVSGIKVILLTDSQGNLKEFKLSFSFSAEIAPRMEIEYDIDYAIILNNFGEPVTPMPPQGWESFRSLAEINAKVFEKIGAAIRKTVQSDEFRVSQISSSEALIGYQSTVMNQKYHLEAKQLKTSPIYAYRVTTDLSGMEVTEDVYFENGTYYITSDLLENPIQTSEVYASGYHVLTQIYSVLQELPDSFAEKAWTDTDDDGHFLYVELTEEEFALLYPNLMEKISSESIGVPVSDRKAEEIYVEIHADHEGNLRFYDIGYTFSFAVELDGELYPSYVSSYASFAFSASITPVSLTPPEGYRDFLLYDKMLPT